MMACGRSISSMARCAMTLHTSTGTISPNCNDKLQPVQHADAFVSIYKLDMLNSRRGLSTAAPCARPWEAVADASSAAATLPTESRRMPGSTASANAAPAPR
jgi:hypothetical protein